LARLAPAYALRRPTETALYALVRDHLETFLAHARETYDAPLPRYVQNELRGYLLCGVFAHGLNLLLADGSVSFTKKGFDETTMRAMITRAGGEQIDISKLDP